MRKIITSSRGVKECNDGIDRSEKEKQRGNFRTILGFKENDIMKVTEQTQLESLKITFELENIQTQYKVLRYEIDLYFHDYKLPIEIDEKDHADRDIDCEIRRQKVLENELSCKLELIELELIIRINPGKENFNISKAENEIFRHIKESTEKLTKNL